jgi:hypothetical protein
MSSAISEPFTQLAVSRFLQVVTSYNLYDLFKEYSMSMSSNPYQEQAAIGAPDGGQFIDPPSMEEQLGNSSGFIPPDTGDTNQNSDNAPVLNAEFVAQARDQIGQRLSQAASAGASSVAQAQNLESPGIVGVGVSSNVPGLDSLVVFVQNAGSQDEVRREIVDSMGVQAASNDDLPVEIIVTGVIEAYTSNRSKFRPAPAGTSTGHFKITAGTIGGWAVGRGSRSNRLLMVSNNHVLANSNSGVYGDNILQPGPADGGVNPADRIAILERFVTINFSGGNNYVDCATGWCYPNLVLRKHVYHGGTTVAKYLRVGSAIVAPQVNMIVGKTGRTTDLTQGRINAVGVVTNVNYGGGKVGHFVDQFSVLSVNANPFSAGGDSGSFVWQWVNGMPVVGLLFAGGGGVTICNRMSRVVTALDITLLADL